jgi:hypothetical protein
MPFMSCSEIISEIMPPFRKGQSHLNPTAHAQVIRLLEAMANSPCGRWPLTMTDLGIGVGLLANPDRLPANRAEWQARWARRRVFMFLAEVVAGHSLFHGEVDMMNDIPKVRASWEKFDRFLRFVEKMWQQSNNAEQNAAVGDVIVDRMSFGEIHQ